jgi:guanylate kinase
MVINHGKKPSSLLVVISAPSGTGKTTLISKLLKHDNFVFSISSTTRAIRAGEVNGKDYHFLTKQEFVKHLNNDAFIEHAEVHGNFYGTSKQEINQYADQHKKIILDIDYQGYLQILEQQQSLMTMPMVSIFIRPASLQVLEQRLIKRNTNHKRDIATRLKNASIELEYAHMYDHQFINDDLEECYENIYTVLQNHQLSPA